MPLSFLSSWRRPAAPGDIAVAGEHLEKLATGFRFVEGPVWIAEEGCLLFSDIPASRIYKFQPSGGKKHPVAVFLEPGGKSNGLTRDGKGRLLLCEHAGRRVSRIEADGSLLSLAEVYEGKRLNSPNDIVVKSNGAIYFTDPPGGIKREEQEQPKQGVFRLSPNGELRLVAEDFDMPNGLAFSPDESLLYIGDSSPRSHVRVFTMREDGSLENGRVFCTLEGSDNCVGAKPDGMKVDREGRLYCTAEGGVHVFSPDGTKLGIIPVPEQPANCAWGDGDRRTLYITARTSVYRIKLAVEGAGVV